MNNKKLEEFNLIIGDGNYSSKYPKGEEFLDYGIPFLSASDFKDKTIDYTKSKKISPELHNQLKKGHVQKGDLLIVVRGNGVGKTGYIDDEIDECNINAQLAFIRSNDASLDNEYLYYNMKYNFEKLKSLATGSAQPQLVIGNLVKYSLSVPSIENQTKIKTILSNIDEKIKLNNEINNNLHELMKIKFNNCIDNLEEYEESVLSKIANYKNGLAMQKFRPIDESGLPVIKIKEMNSGITSETERCRSDIDSDVIIDNGDILFAWSGTLCMNIWCGGRAGLNQHIFKVTSDKYPKWFYYFWTLKHLDNFIEIAAGKATTMGHIKRTELDKAIVKIPNEKIMEKMDKIFTPMLNKYVNNSIESKSLSELRDTLLPKLMNGEIDLDNIEI